jgi:hypothetical protein
VDEKPQSLRELLKKCEAEVVAKGEKFNAHRDIYNKFLLRREGAAEDGTGGRIVAEVSDIGEKEAENPQESMSMEID